MTRGQLKRDGIRIDRMLLTAATVWLATAAAAYGAWRITGASNVEGGPLIPLGVFLGGLGFVVRVTWRVATERKGMLDRMRRFEELLGRLPCLKESSTAPICPDAGEMETDDQP